MSNKVPLNSFTINGLRFHCGQCKFDGSWSSDETCCTCIGTKPIPGGGHYPFVTGCCFRHEDPEYVEKLASLASQYAPRLQELEQARKQVRKELAKSAKELGVKVPDFDFACKEIRTHE